MTRSLLIMLLVSFSLSAQAVDVTVMTGYQFNNDFKVNSITAGDELDDLELTDGSTASLAVDFVFNENANQRIGFFVSHQQSDFGINASLANPKVDITHIHFTAMNYYPQGKMEPFFMAGLGAGMYSPKDNSLSDENKFSAQIGGGTNYKFTDNLLLHLDVRLIATFFHTDSAIFCDAGCTIILKSDIYTQVQANIGLMFRF